MNHSIQYTLSLIFLVQAIRRFRLYSSVSFKPNITLPKKNDLFGGVNICVKKSYSLQDRFWRDIFMFRSRKTALPAFHKGGVK